MSLPGIRSTSTCCLQLAHGLASLPTKSSEHSHGQAKVRPLSIDTKGLVEIPRGRLRALHSSQGQPRHDEGFRIGWIILQSLSRKSQRTVTFFLSSTMVEAARENGASQVDPRLWVFGRLVNAILETSDGPV
jgi:hypothetical protein